jgi:hypothetical protein
MHRFSLALAAALVLLVPSAALAKKRPQPPSKATIQKLMTEMYVGDDPQMYPGTRYSLKVTGITRGAPRKGSYRHDGVPPGKTTIVFPTKVTMVYVVCYTDGSARRDDIVDKQVFFRDDFGEWTNRLQDQKRTDGSSDKLAACPL